MYIDIYRYTHRHEKMTMTNVCMYVCMYRHIYTFVCVHTYYMLMGHASVYVQACTHTSFIFIYECIYTYTNVCKSINVFDFIVML